MRVDEAGPSRNLIKIRCRPTKISAHAHLRKGQQYVTVVHDLDAKRLLFATPGKDHKTVEEFAVDLEAHGGARTAIAHACMDMSAAFLKGATLSLPKALISYDPRNRS